MNREWKRDVSSEIMMEIAVPIMNESSHKDEDDYQGDLQFTFIYSGDILQLFIYISNPFLFIRNLYIQLKIFPLRIFMFTECFY